MLKRLLIANRGEIACRIARSARALGIASIAVYSDADRGARHVRECDEAVHLGPAPAAQSYLDIEAVIAAARRADADAIHPGYGFLSENAAFAQACESAAIVFVGPPAAAIRAMGSKSEAKAAMAAAGVPVAPGYHGEDQSIASLKAEAQRVGFPLIVKASAGGGGKGMQVVESAAQLAPAIESAQRLARTAFGDERLLLERYFRGARHVEVQIFADADGEVRSLFDRDCSIQRRHQKVIEEAPAPGLTAPVRESMAAAAVKVARAVGYRGAGTIEFLLDTAQNFYFMEMNTRLQVEHAVTEMITGIDLVEWQLRVASGQRFADFAAPATAVGAAIEARVYAEDPAHDYLPSTGRILHLRWPPQSPKLRCDIGVESDDSVSPFYDPMLGKIIAWGNTRTEAIARLRGALAELEIVGVNTNAALLASVLADPQFAAEALATDFLQRRAAALEAAQPPPEARDYIAAALRCANADRLLAGPISPWEATSGWRIAAPALTRWRFGEVEVTLAAKAPQEFVASVHSRSFPVRILELSAECLRFEMERQVLAYRLWLADAKLHLFRDGRRIELQIARTEDALRTSVDANQGSLVTPLPGTVVAIHVAAGQAVASGAALITVEAMKMEHTLTAPYDGVVARIPYALAERVAEGAVLIELERAKSG